MTHAETLIVGCPQCGVAKGAPCRPRSGHPHRPPYNPKFYAHNARHLAAAGHLKVLALAKMVLQMHFILTLDDPNVRDSVAFKNDMCAVEIILTKYGKLDTDGQADD